MTASGRKNFRGRIFRRRSDNMDSVNSAKNIKPTAIENGHQYNWQHFVFVTKYRYKMFKNEKTVAIIKKAIIDAASRNNISIKEFSFGDDYSHIHLELNVPPTLSISQVAQFLKGFSSYIVFKEMPDHRLRYPNGAFWSAGYSSSSVGPQTEEIVRNYIRRQDISGQMKLT